MNRGARWLGALWLLVGPGCDGPESLEGGLVLGTVQAHRLCDVNGVEIGLVAHWQECPEGEPDCPTPEETSIVGDRFACPSTDRTRELGVELPFAGRYRIEVSTVQVSGPPEVECFAPPGASEGLVELPTSRLSDVTPIELHEHGPCP